MIPVIEDYLSDLIEQGIAAVKSNVSGIDSILAMRQPKLDSLKTYLQNNQINVTMGYPRTPADLPSIVILIGNDGEEQDSLGDQLGFGMGDDEGDDIISMYESDFRIEVWSENMDLTVGLYHLVKYFIMSGRDTLGEQGIVRHRLGGQDLEPAPQYFPTFVYRRALTFWCQFEASAEPINSTAGNYEVINDFTIAEPTLFDTEE